MDPSDVPPPPYSERDRQHHHNNDNSRPATSTGHLSPWSAVPSSLPVYPSPPITPSIDASDVTITNNNGFDPPSLSSSSARAYFESRPLPPGFYREVHITHTISVSAASSPDQLPYNPDFGVHDVTPQDWHTFLNFLLPHHATLRNEAIIDRKLLAEEPSAAAGSSLTPHGRSSSSQGRNQASAHLERLRLESTDIHALTPSATVKQEAEAVTFAWNHGFFQPRAIWVRLVFESSLEGRQAQDSDIRDRSHLQTPQYQPPFGLSAPMQPPIFHPPMVFHAQPYGAWHKEQGENGFSFAGINIRDDGFSIGNTVVADRNGIRVGGLIADVHGVRYLDNVIAGRAPFPADPNPGPYLHTRGRPPALGSLPDLQPHQMTNEEVRRLNAELRKAKDQKADFIAEGVDKKALRVEVKGLLLAWKTVERTQRIVKRTEKRARKKVARKERQERKRELRRVKENQAREGSRNAWRNPAIPPPGMGTGVAGPAGPRPPHGPSIHVSPPLHGFPHGPWVVHSAPTTPFGVPPGHGAEGIGPQQRHFPPFPPPGGWPAEERRAQAGVPGYSQAQSERVWTVVTGRPQKYGARPRGSKRRWRN
ncbi:hypothetical protein SODALDRAFT_322614 [Sodiomyces alkalinus F11]|uniref:Uncharacterized protein n=1 Tax=Sodiomyces alkalinus (strain CBS 110278 / VKM F-3762 / F11) TaxID=1314773 RepID=A0A3N2Q4C1_SODAK|nr:hypothetical protein SODALDRAFT_322614 [Sodiomyces alkalinus F11]ROT41498.1 hypothetical protein SODALDRAFT_322614 [Sodiomyces alkalinus F11]